MRAHLGALRSGDADLSLGASRSARRRAAARGRWRWSARRLTADRRDGVRRGQRARARARRRAAAARRCEAGARSRDGAVSERTLVLLSGAQCRAGRSGVIDVAVRVLRDAECSATLSGRRRGPASSQLQRAYRCDACTRAGDDDRLSDALVRRGGRTAGGGARLRDRSVSPDRGSRGRTRRFRSGFTTKTRRWRRFSTRRRAQPIDGVLAVGDRPTVIAARVAQALGLPWHPPEAAAVARHKLLHARTAARCRACRCPGSVPLAERRTARQRRSRSPCPRRIPASSSRSRCPAAAA